MYNFLKYINSKMKIVNDINQWGEFNEQKDIKNYINSCIIINFNAAA